MRNRLLFAALYGLAWTLVFQFFRVVFIGYHYQKALEIHPSLWAASAAHGLRMDVSFASYLLVLPTLLLVFTKRRWDWYRRTIGIYTLIIGIIISLLVTVDLELFRAWGFRIDASSLHYLETPAEAWASAGAAPVLLLSAILIFLTILVSSTFDALIRRSVSSFRSLPHFWHIPVFLLLTASLIIPIRGGFQLAPMNQSTVFFSDKSFANYAAVNVPWNYASSLVSASYSSKNPFVYFEAQEAIALVNNLYRQGGDCSQMVDTAGKPNVIVIIWESFTAKITARLGNAKAVTPHFDSLAKEGILFTNMYASGNRSDKGIVSILSGYPAQPTSSIIKIPKKTASLPSLPTEFSKRGWHTSFYYGGETEFANMKSYFLQQHFDRIVDKNDFDKKDMNSKWGAHDHVVLGRLLDDLDQENQPFFSTLFTLSSHEPFEVPVKTAIAGSDPEHLFLNAHHYTDSAIFDFIQKAKSKPWWNNTLLVIIADHGHPLPYTAKTKPSEFHIPMLWLGGALKNQSMEVNTLCSQTDLAATLLDQLHFEGAKFDWSDDIFRKDRAEFAYFAFNNGFGWIKPEGYLVRDNIGGNITEREGTLGDKEIDLGKAYLQASFTDYLRR